MIRINTGLIVALALYVGAAQAAAPRLQLLDKPRPISVVRFEDGQGRRMTLADFRGKVILLNVWATQAYGL